MVNLSILHSYITSKHIRLTQHLSSVLEMFVSNSHPIEAKTIYNNLQVNNIPINLSTIHRILDKLQNIGVLDAIYQDKVTAYELSSQFLGHHHHFTCIQCQTIIDIPQCFVHTQLQSIPDIGEPISHSFEVKGICKKCLNSKAYTE